MHFMNGCAGQVQTLVSKRAAQSTPWEDISICASKATMSKLVKVTERMELDLQRGQFFTAASEGAPCVPAFDWKSDKEGAHYTTAETWAQNNLCPTGVVAVQKPKHTLFDW